MKKLEDGFQSLAESILTERVSSFDAQQTHTISLFYALWMARSEIRFRPEQDKHVPAILHGGYHSKSKEEQLEKAGYTFFRGSTLPGRMMNGVRVRVQAMRYVRKINPTANWRIVRALSGEFLVPDWPVYAFIPITPTLALVNGAFNQLLDRQAVGLVNVQLKSQSRLYFFARDFGSCPGLSAQSKS
jgi:hypothetical protein